MVRKMTFPEILDYRFTISGEMIPEKGEDSYCSGVTENAALAAVFDGCGGLGSREYSTLSEKTGAYVASRAVSGAVYDWFTGSNGGAGLSQEEIRSDLCEYMNRAYGVCRKYGGETSVLSGSLIRDFPSTAAAVIARQCPEGIELLCFWAGDSRIYFLDSEGLSQLSLDDIRGDFDAMENLYRDASLSNVLSSDGNYVLHQRRLVLNSPALVFTATDGCFGYLPSPMHFEYMILKNLLAADNPPEFEDTLEREIRKYAGDDYALSLMSFGFGDFAGLQSTLKGRRDYLKNVFIDPMEESADESLPQSLWQEYRVGYEHMIKE